MSISIEVELVMPAMPRSLSVKTLRPMSLDSAHDRVQVNVADLDSQTVDKICEQWAMEFRAFVASQKKAAQIKEDSKSSFYFGDGGK
jgi:hypothetical protein